MKTTDANGWQYANSWKGPWSYLASRTSFVRRRKWVRTYRAKHDSTIRDRTESHFSTTSSQHSVHGDAASGDRFSEDAKSSTIVLGGDADSGLVRGGDWENDGDDMDMPT